MTPSTGATARSPTRSTGRCRARVIAMSALRRGEVGAYDELVKRPLPEGLRLVFIPSLVGMLARTEQENGAALTEDEVLQIRDRWGGHGHDGRARASVGRKTGLCRYLAELVAAAGGSGLERRANRKAFQTIQTAREDTRPHSGGPIAPRDARQLSLCEQRAQGMPGEGLTHGPRAMKKHGEGTTGSAGSSGIPCAVVLRLIARSPRRPGFLAPVAARSSRAT